MMKYTFGKSIAKRRGYLKSFAILFLKYQIVCQFQQKLCIMVKISGCLFWGYVAPSDRSPRLLPKAGLWGSPQVLQYFFKSINRSEHLGIGFCEFCNNQNNLQHSNIFEKHRNHKSLASSNW